ncbi:LysM peptidoglycan-binding domain-containing protein [Trueperella bernardiae]|uniref:LysM peptidoglycan-binding domain-containing protein n=1 Tax=Trueperella bernardiae TaxID=59561 RepID=UPI0025571B3D|nr:LysM peptidoglycan-binding domain-containing protein [Trueperella bernardiae]WIM07490.1 LysM peptidoglycan-binding domain-containing protein [Trueperella bernardiae]
MNPSHTGAPQQDLEAVLVAASAVAIALVVLWYLIAALALLRASRSGSRTLRARVARWGPPILKGIAAAGLAGSFIAPASADVDLSWGAPLPSASTLYEPAGAIHDADPAVASETAVAPLPEAGPVAAAEAPRIGKPLHDAALAATRESAPIARVDHTAGATLISERTHIVEAGDCLWSIARDYYSPSNDSELADIVLDLYLANKGVIGDDPNLIRPGQIITLP